MPWFLRTSRHGVHAVYGQQADNSCGIACVIMVNFKMKKWEVASAAATVASNPIVGFPALGLATYDAVKRETEVYGAYSKVTGQKYDGTTYTDATVLPRVLNELSIGRWVAACVTARDLAGSILDKYSRWPFITLVHWRAGGGHFVICDNVEKSGTGGSADFCDPWDTSVRTLTLVRGRAITYQVEHATGQVDLGQTHYAYANAAKKADMDGWIIYRA